MANEHADTAKEANPIFWIKFRRFIQFRTLEDRCGVSRYLNRLVQVWVPRLIFGENHLSAFQRIPSFFLDLINYNMNVLRLLPQVRY